MLDAGVFASELNQTVDRVELADDRRAEFIVVERRF